jgi:hypothetical protein
MPRVPTTVQDLLNFCSEHGTVWKTAPTTIGLTAAQITAFKSVTRDTTAGHQVETAAIPGIFF